ncbi:hypothetical protein NIES4074_03540 [Cylindrospermum sp. NIES-4074]|jgi:predicted RNase H-like HicB family nuclease|nr:hypothetical protein NIES4074_03540 [Cylindrospermum sp. NIES-4074]
MQYQLIPFCLIEQDRISDNSGDRDMRYKVNLNKTDKGYAIWCPALPGCWTQGATEEEALENIKYAIKAYLDAVDEVTKIAEFYYVDVR